MFSYIFLERIASFLLICPFFMDKCEVLLCLPIKQTALATCCGLLDGFLTVHRTSRCSGYVIPLAVGHKYGFV